MPLRKQRDDPTSGIALKPDTTPREPPPPPVPAAHYNLPGNPTPYLAPSVTHPPTRAPPPALDVEHLTNSGHRHSPTPHRERSHATPKFFHRSKRLPPFPSISECPFPLGIADPRPHSRSPLVAVPAWLTPATIAWIQPPAFLHTQATASQHFFFHRHNLMSPANNDLLHRDRSRSRDRTSPTTSAENHFHPHHNPNLHTTSIPYGRPPTPAPLMTF